MGCDRNSLGRASLLARLRLIPARQSRRAGSPPEFTSVLRRGRTRGPRARRPRCPPDRESRRMGRGARSEASRTVFQSLEGRCERMQSGADGILRSTVFPGLWLDPGALLREEPAAMFAVLQQGLNSPEHADFVARLERARVG